MYHKQERCLCCDSSDLELLLDLNNQPLANSYHTNDLFLPEYPLGVNLCKKCYHIQLTHIVNPDLLFKDYLYVSGTSQTMRDHFEWFSNFVIEYANPKSVLDIACNDGSQLDCFKNKGIETFGIDPAENLYNLSSKNHNVICDYFNKDSYNRKFDVIVAQNVFAHNKNHKKFLDDCSNIMHDDSYLFIQTSQAEMVQNNQFDTIYHEHISFFNSNSMNELAKRTDLNLIDIIKTSIHGISYLFVFSKKNINKYLVENLIDVERTRGLLSNKLYDEYKQNIQSVVKDFKNTINEYKDKGFKIVGYGAAAKGMTFLNFADTTLDIIIDDNPLKQNLYTPGTNILIKSVDYIKTYKPEEKILYVPLAWNFYNEIKERILKVRDNSNDLFLKYFPTLKIEK
tara:strand:+ start:2870 stop:4060 length:1191 start_codon:yes stop_codon:yes gene_type:complete